MATDTNIDNWESHWMNMPSSVKENPVQEYRRQLILDGFQNKIIQVVDCGSGPRDLVHYLNQGKKKKPQFLALN